ncbi:ATP-dependent helicase [Candidatus Saccharibacteria bacterium CG10_big_fil_rev_8_21_14_0_10_47_8]|nr:MAG: ATP-dependent helicase [Candidatus Saccharibacteria bacterium CG10_big_fil_rev_8_21_14_0_10_47_8]
MRSNSHNHGPRRLGTRHFGPSTRSNSRNRGAKQTIHPSRFVKTANPALVGDYKSQHSFNDFAIHPILKSNVAIKGYKSPSEIQDKTIVLGLAGQDVVGVANTGTGKTAAFALPILNKLLHDRDAMGLIIAPTRELAIQIEEQCRQFAKNSGLSGALLIGGLPMGRQINALKNHPRIIIGTPGRIKDHVGQGTLRLSGCTMVVLDEVDRMLDMGFLPDVRFLLDLLPQSRQSFFFSATLGPTVNDLIKTFTRDAVTINVKAGETSDNVHQDIVPYDGKTEKLDRLHDVLIGERIGKTLIFGNTKYGVERLAKELIARGFKADALHGGKNQGQRQRALDSFREGNINVLVATDVAARGIDVIDITHVINFDVPKTYDDYSYRIGRAGRAGRTGYALTFVAA